MGMAPRELIQFKFKTLKYIDDELALSMRQKFLVGREVEGLLQKRGTGYFIQWNEEIADDIFVSEQSVEQSLGIWPLPEKQLMGPGMKVKCTIEKMGPSHAHWLNQHPMTKNLAAVARGRFERTVDMKTSEYVKQKHSKSTSPRSSGDSLKKKITGRTNMRPPALGRFINKSTSKSEYVKQKHSKSTSPMSSGDSLKKKITGRTSMRPPTLGRFINSKKAAVATLPKLPEKSRFIGSQ